MDKPVAFPTLQEKGNDDNDSKLSGHVFARVAEGPLGGGDTQVETGNMYIGYDDDESNNNEGALPLDDGGGGGGAVKKVLPDQLPGDLVEVIDKFIDGLQAPVYKAPLGANDLSKIFQDFYIQSHERVVRYMRRYSLLHHRNDNVPLQTYQEIVKRKQERREREEKTIQYDELLEQEVCIRLYDKLFALKASTDATRDQIVSDKMEALKTDSKVTLQQLGVGEEEEEEEEQEGDKSIAAKVIEAGSGFNNINIVKYPKGKIDILISIHKQLVNALLSSSSSSQHNNNNDKLSADSILPALIYTTIHNKPMNFISNLEFIVRFRNQIHLHGEIAYCLTNFEAVGKFLENVNLDTLDTAVDEVLPQEMSLSPSAVVVGGGGSSTRATLSSTLESSKNFAYKLIAGRQASNSIDDGNSESRSRNTSNVSNDEIGSSSRPHHVLGRMMRNFAISATTPVAQQQQGVNNKQISSSTEKISPPISQFLETKSAMDLRLGDVEILLDDYKRLAGYLFSS